VPRLERHQTLSFHITLLRTTLVLAPGLYHRAGSASNCIERLGAAARQTGPPYPVVALAFASDTQSARL
jgi:hypothetical protein